MEKLLYNAMLSNFQKEIKENFEEIKNLEKIDLKYCNIKIEINIFFEIIENYKNVIHINNYTKNLSVFCNGNPYIVLNLILIAIINNFNLKINVDNTMLGINSYLIKLINNILIKNNLKIRIELFEKLDNEENIIFIDRINDFNILKTKNKNIKFIPYQSIDIYSDSEEFEELFEKIYNYALDMNIDVDIFDEEGIEGLIKYGKGKIKLILTKNEEIINKYKNKNIFINYNPFKEKNIIFDVKIISLFDY